MGDFVNPEQQPFLLNAEAPTVFCRLVKRCAVFVGQHSQPDYVLVHQKTVTNFVV